jgi:hypothetical protein
MTIESNCELMRRDVETFIAPLWVSEQNVRESEECCYCSYLWSRICEAQRTKDDRMEKYLIRQLRDHEKRSKSHAC